MKKTPIIILVEDEEELRRSMDFTLRRKGYRVEAFRNAETALMAFGGAAGMQGRPDLLITDIRMPGMGGVGLVEQTKVLIPPIPILVVTGQAGKDERRRLAELGVTRILSKPFSLQELVREVEKALTY